MEDNTNKQSAVTENVTTSNSDLNNGIKNNGVIDNTSDNTKNLVPYFYAELMATAGPRKNFEEDATEGDFDLGEDSVGCFIKKDKIFFWLLDGTSDSSILKNSEKKEYFSSRLLAQELGYHIQDAIWTIPLDSFNSEIILKNAIGNIKESWQRRIAELAETDKDALQSKIEERTRITVSTTVILGMLTIDGSLNISQIGDSVIILNPDHIFPKNNGRLFVFVSKNESGEISLTTSADKSFEDTRCQTKTLQDIDSVILASDGVSKNTISWLKMRKPDFKNPAFRHTISAIKQGTCDDKTLCVIQILTDD
ncbi:protein phosphatase 2C domain-containing protein [Bacteroidales bacterium OttesenSCG-928-B11]|nr:protein phosphatase 2C domain-containing protein [Bacteroidales bacterium OttesenSCG-928-B11]